MNFSTSGGFTLLELILVIVITGIVTAMSTDILTYPIQSYVALQRRTTLVDDAEMSLRRMQRDIRAALPNSIRITDSGQVMEILHTIDGGRYRSTIDGTKVAGSGLCDGDHAHDVLDFAANDSCFEIIGALQNFNVQATSGESLVIYNMGSGSADAYAGTNRSLLANSGNSTTLTFSALKFPHSSPQQRFFIVDTPITYRCDLATGRLLRYSKYTIAATQPNPPAVTAQLQANRISNCAFSYVSGIGSRSGLVVIDIALTDDAGESVRLMHQIHVDNAP